MPKKARGSFSIQPDLLRRARNTVAALAGPPERLTLTGLLERGLRVEIERLERQYNQGVGFPDFEGQVRTGRPLGRGGDGG